MFADCKQYIFTHSVVLCVFKHIVSCRWNQRIHLLMFTCMVYNVHTYITDFNSLAAKQQYQKPDLPSCFIKAIT